MALKSIQQVPSLAERLTNVRLDRFDPSEARFRNCVLNGLAPEFSNNPTLSNSLLTPGQAMIGGALYDFPAASAIPAFTPSAWNYVWLDDTGTVQIGAAWPGSGDFVKVGAVYCDSVDPLAARLNASNRNLMLGYNPTERAFVADCPGTPGVRSALWEITGNVSTYNEYGIKFCTHGYFPQVPVIDQVAYQMNTCNVSGTDKCITARAGFMEADEETWVEGAYKDITLTNGSGVKYFTFDAPWMPDPQKEYVMCLELTERGPSFVSTDFQTKGYSQLPAWAKYWVMDQSNGSTHIKSSTGVWAWDSTSIPTSAIRGYPAHGIYAEIAAEELAEAPTTFQTLINARARDIASGEYSDIDPATQIVRAEVSLDGGSHWTPLAPGEDLSTLYTGTDLIFRLLAGNNNAKEIVIPSLGFSYEV